MDQLTSGIFEPTNGLFGTALRKTRPCEKRGRNDYAQGVQAVDLCLPTSDFVKRKGLPLDERVSRTSPTISAERCKARLAYARHVAKRLLHSILESPVGQSTPFCVHSVLTGLLSNPGSKHSTPTHPTGGGAQSEPLQSSASSGLGKRNIGLTAMPP